LGRRRTGGSTGVVLLATTLRRENRATTVSSKPTPSLGALLGMGVSMALCIAAGFGGGYWLDETFKTGLVFIFVGLFLGIVAAVAVVYFEVKTYL
jgi:hypothetical protein